MLQQAIFYIFAGLTVIGALMVITQNNPVRCVLFLVAVFISTSVLWLLVASEFLALILVLVYVGAVMTLFLFVVMMLNIDTESQKKEMLRRIPFGLLIVAIIVSLLLMALPKEFAKGAIQAPPSLKTSLSTSNTIDNTKANTELSNTERLGMVLYTDYFYAFEIAAVILLAAIIAAITLAHRAPISIKRQDIKKQIMTEKSSRLKIIKD